MEKKGEIEIDILPPEVLELVFKELSTLNDIQSCYNTSRRWRTIITKMFKEKGEQSQDTFSRARSDHIFRDLRSLTILLT